MPKIFLKYLFPKILANPGIGNTYINRCMEIVIKPHFNCTPRATKFRKNI